MKIEKTHIPRCSVQSHSIGRVLQLSEGWMANLEETLDRLAVVRVQTDWNGQMNYSFLQLNELLISAAELSTGTSRNLTVHTNLTPKKHK